VDVTGLRGVALCLDEPGSALRRQSLTGLTKHVYRYVHDAVQPALSPFQLPPPLTLSRKTVKFPRAEDKTVTASRTFYAIFKLPSERAGITASELHESYIARRARARAFFGYRVALERLLAKALTVA